MRGGLLGKFSLRFRSTFSYDALWHVRGLFVYTIIDSDFGVVMRGSLPVVRHGNGVLALAALTVTWLTSVTGCRSELKSSRKRIITVRFSETSHQYCVTLVSTAYHRDADGLDVKCRSIHVCKKIMEKLQLQNGFSTIQRLLRYWSVNYFRLFLPTFSLDWNWKHGILLRLRSRRRPCLLCFF